MGCTILHTAFLDAAVLSEQDVSCRAKAAQAARAEREREEKGQRDRIQDIAKDIKFN